MSEYETYVATFTRVTSQIKSMSRFRLFGIVLLVIYAFVKMSGMQDGMVITSTAQAIGVLVFEILVPLVSICLIIWSTMMIRKLKIFMYQRKVCRDDDIQPHILSD